jgi:hypothetical protein
MKQGNAGVELLITIRDEAGQPVDLTAAASAKLILSINGKRTERMCGFADRQGGVVRYVASAEDLREPGLLCMEVEVVFQDGRVLVTDVIKDTVKGRL